MVVRKIKKVVKYRGSKTHGGGSMKKRRGAGHRGGRGRAGSGKRGDAKKPRYWKEKQGKIGFTSIRKIGGSAGKSMNVGHLNSSVETMVSKGEASVKDGSYVIDLSAIGVSKLLGSGNVSKKFVISVSNASSRAVAKIKEAGGDVKLPSKGTSEVS